MCKTFLTLFVVLPCWGFWTFYLVRWQAGIVGTSILPRTAKCSAAVRALALEEQSWQVRSWPQEAPKAKLQWRWAKSPHSAGGGSNGTGGWELPKAAGRFWALFHADLGSLQLHCLKEGETKISLIPLKEKGKSWYSKETSNVIYNIYKSLLSGKCCINFYPLKHTEGHR